MRVDLHNHTKLCNHATGESEEYIQKAIQLGIDVYGFSDHAPMPYDFKYRMSIEQTKAYETEILDLQNKYKKDIKILLAYEVDFMQNSSLMLEQILCSKVDYLIGSVHFIEEKSKNLWGFDNPEFIGKYREKNINDIWTDYFYVIEKLAKSKLFDVVGHFDLIKVFNFLPSKDIKLLANNALREIKNSNMVLEINSAGLRKPIKETYPSRELLEVAYELDIPITFSSDAHKIEDIGSFYEETSSLAKSVGYTKCAIFENRDRTMVDF